MFTLHLIFLLKNKFFHLNIIKCSSNIVDFLYTSILWHFIVIPFASVSFKCFCFIFLFAFNVF